MSLEITLNAGKSTTKINEFPDGSSSAYLYNPEGVDIAYGFNGEKHYMYGAIDASSAEFAFGGKEQSGGLHSINLSRELKEGEEVRLVWRNGYQLIIFSEIIEENGVKKRITKAKKPSGGSYQEIGKWVNSDGSSENTCIMFEDNVLTKRFDYIKIMNFKEI